MTTKKNDKKKSAARKLIPAIGMLTVSAMMLSSSTYAWFTMSREVEVTNIQMTATTPEDMQISLGQIMAYDSKASAVETYSLSKGTGLLLDASGTATAPREEGTANDELDWSNIADISAYYEFGKLIPASSTDGANVYYTPDAAGVGRTFTATAAFYQAASGATAYKTGGTAAVGSGEDSAKATAFIKTATQKPASSTGTAWNSASGAYQTALEWNDTNDDGYYIDIPVWLRTSSTGTVTSGETTTGATKVYVTGYVTSQSTSAADTDTDDLYKAVRVAILSTSGEGGMTYAADKGCLTLADGSDQYIDPVTGQGTHAGKFPTWTGFDNILDSDNYNASGTDNLSGIANLVGRAYTTANAGKIFALSGTGSTTNAANVKEGTLSEIMQNNAAAANNVAVLNPGTGQGYGTSTKLIIRVWLEGEDGNCWNENAGQNWNIALKFSKTPLPTTAPSSGSGSGSEGA